MEFPQCCKFPSSYIITEVMTLANILNNLSRYILISLKEDCPVLLLERQLPFSSSPNQTLELANQNCRQVCPGA